MEFSRLLLNLLREIPATFGGVVVGSFFSIFGVWLSNRASEKRLRSQFEHEMRQKSKEREIAAKKEIYLDAVVSLAAGLRAVGELANVYKTDAELLKGVREGDDGHSVVKVTVVASGETVRAFAKLNDGIRAAFLRLYPRRVELLLEKDGVDRLDAFSAKSVKEQDHLLEQMKQKNLARDVDEASWFPLNRAFELESSRQKDTLDQRQKQYRSLTAAQLDFNRQCLDAVTELMPRFAPVLSGVRNELEMPLPEAILLEVLRDQEEVRLAMDEASRRFAAMAGLVGAGSEPQAVRSFAAQ